MHSNTDKLYIVEKLYMSQMSQMKTKEFVHNTAYSVQLPYIAGLSLKVNTVNTTWKKYEYPEV